jgi:hypothetical protein
MGDVIAGIDFRSGYAKKYWQHDVADERRKEADRLAKSADTAPSDRLTDGQINYAHKLAEERRQVWADTAPSEYVTPEDEPA